MTSSIRLLVAIAAQLLVVLPVEAASYAYASYRSMVHVIDVANPSIVARIPIGIGSGDTPALDSRGANLYVPNFAESTVTVVDTASRTVVGQIPVSRPKGILGHQSRNVVYVRGSTTVDGIEFGFVAVIDTVTHAVIATIVMGPSSEVRDMILDPAGTRLYASVFQGAGGKVVVVDTSTQTVASSISVEAPRALAVHPAGTFVYIINNSGIAVLNTATNMVEAMVPGAQFASAPTRMVVQPNGSFVYVLAGINWTVLNAPRGYVAVVDTRTNQVTATISVPMIPESAALTPSGTRLYTVGNVPQQCFRPPCSLSAAPTVVIDTTTNAVITTVPPGPFGGWGGSVTVDPSGQSVYANAGSGLTVVNASTNAIMATLPTGGVVFGATRPTGSGDQVFYAIGSRDGSQRRTQWGAPGDRPVLADYDGDGRADVAIFRPREAGQEAVWWIQRSSDGGIERRQWGAVSFGDVPVAADYDGDGKADLAVWREWDLSAAGMWHIFRSSDGGVVEQQWGSFGDLPVPADYDGDGHTDIAVWRPSLGTWYVLNSRDGSVTSRQFGVVTDVPVPADYDGDHRADFAVWRPSSGVWFVMGSQTGVGTAMTFGAPGDVPVPQDYDGDGKADIAVWRPSTGEWFILRSSDGRVVARALGERGDLPLPADVDGDRAADLMVYRP